MTPRLKLVTDISCTKYMAKMALEGLNLPPKMVTLKKLMAIFSSLSWSYLLQA